MADKIRIRDLEVFANHGVFPEENKLGQKFVISATLYTDTRRAGLSDDLTQSIHYGEVCHRIHAFLREHTFQLIERVAEALCADLLRNTPLLGRVRLEVKKPWAPIGLPVGYASVEIERGWHTAYLGIGSNMGDSRQYLDDAVAALTALEDCRVARVSEWVTTKPYGVTNQDDFLNGCLELMTLLPPAELLERLHEIERQAGRERTLRWGPRTLDLDILLYDDQILHTPELNIPHIDMHNRAFVLAPLAEIAPHAWHPVLGKTATQLLADLPDKGE